MLNKFRQLFGNRRLAALQEVFVVYHRDARPQLIFVNPFLLKQF